MPNTGDMQLGMLARTPLVARRGGGFYVAYPTGYPSSNRVRLWRIGAPRATLIARVAGGSPAVAIASADDGRLWVLWTKGFGDPDVLATRSNPSVTRFGAVVDAGHPKDAAQAYNLDASAIRGALDVLGNFNIGTTTTAVTSYRRILPGLTLGARPHRVRKGKPTDVRFTVIDAGAPVKGAKVRAGGKSATTGKDGRVTLSLSLRKPVTARATHSGYSAATKRVGVRR
jgi:hypothetical protein